MVSLFYSINHSLISCNCKSFLFLSSPLVVLKRCLEKFFVYILRLLAGKLGKICTAVSLASFRQKNLTKYYVKFPAKRYSYIISKKNLVVIFLSWYLHQFLIYYTRVFLGVWNEKASCKAKVLINGTIKIYCWNNEFFLMFWWNPITFFFRHKTCHAYDALSFFKIFKAVSFQM